MSYKIDLHTHTIASGHAYNTINEMVAMAKEKNMTHLGITEHAPKMPGTCHELYFVNLKVVNRDQGSVKLLLGSEVNIIDYTGKVDLSQGMLGRLDVVIASLHIPCIKPGTIEENTAAITGAMRNPYINVIGHPDDGRYPVDYEVIVKEARDTGTLLELNNNSLRPTGPRLNTRENDIEMLKLCMKYNVPIIFGSDAHTDEDIGNFAMCESVVEKLGFPQELIANSSYDMLEKFLNKRK